MRIKFKFYFYKLALLIISTDFLPLEIRYYAGRFISNFLNKKYLPFLLPVVKFYFTKTKEQYHSVMDFTQLQITPIIHQSSKSAIFLNNVFMLIWHNSITGRLAINNILSLVIEYKKINQLEKRYLFFRYRNPFNNLFFFIPNKLNKLRLILSIFFIPFLLPFWFLSSISFSVILSIFDILVNPVKLLNIVSYVFELFDIIFVFSSDMLLLMVDCVKLIIRKLLDILTKTQQRFFTFFILHMVNTFGVSIYVFSLPYFIYLMQGLALFFYFSYGLYITLFFSDYCGRFSLVAFYIITLLFLSWVIGIGKSPEEKEDIWYTAIFIVTLHYVMFTYIIEPDHVHTGHLGTLLAYPQSEIAIVPTGLNYYGTLPQHKDEAINYHAGFTEYPLGAKFWVHRQFKKFKPREMKRKKWKSHFKKKIRRTHEGVFIGLKNIQHLKHIRYGPVFLRDESIIKSLKESFPDEDDGELEIEPGAFTYGWKEDFSLRRHRARVRWFYHKCLLETRDEALDSFFANRTLHNLVELGYLKRLPGDNKPEASFNYPDLQVLIDASRGTENFVGAIEDASWLLRKQNKKLAKDFGINLNTTLFRRLFTRRFNRYTRRTEKPLFHLPPNYRIHPRKLAMWGHFEKFYLDSDVHATLSAINIVRWFLNLKPYQIPYLTKPSHFLGWADDNLFIYKPLFLSYWPQMMTNPRPRVYMPKFIQLFDEDVNYKGFLNRNILSRSKQYFPVIGNRRYNAKLRSYFYDIRAIRKFRIVEEDLNKHPIRYKYPIDYRYPSRKTIYKPPVTNPNEEKYTDERKEMGIGKAKKLNKGEKLF